MFSARTKMNLKKNIINFDQNTAAFDQNMQQSSFELGILKYLYNEKCVFLEIFVFQILFKMAI